MRRALLLAALLSLTSLPAAAAGPSAAEISAARKLFDEALAHEAAGRWFVALDLLKRILPTKETAGIRFHMAACEEHLGQLLASEADYKRAAEMAPSMPGNEGPAIQKNATDALARLRTRIPLVVIRAGAAPGLVVSINGAPLAADRLGIPVPLDPGDVTIRASAPGFQPISRTLLLAEGATVPVDIALSVETAPPPQATPAAPPPAPAPRPRWPAYAAGAAGLTAAGIAAAFYLQHRRLQRETDARCADPAWICDRAGRDDRIADYRAYGLTSAGVAAAALGFSAVWLFSTPSSQTSVALGPSGAWVQRRW